MSFVSELLSFCVQKEGLRGFNICLMKQHHLSFYFSNAWPYEKIKRSLSINISENELTGGGWNIFCISSKDFNFYNDINKFSRNKYSQIDLKDDNGIMAFYDEQHDILRVYDLSKKVAAIVLGTKAYLNEWDIHSPFREFFNIWALKNNALLIHSGVISYKSKAILLPGAGGSGKSTTTISCLQNGMKTTGDDYNLVFMKDNKFWVSALYANVKLKMSKQGKIPFDMPIINDWEFEKLSYAEKIIYFPPEGSDIWDTTTPELKGILCPRITSENTKPNISGIRLAELVNRLAITSVMQSPYIAKEYLAKCVLLAKHIQIAYLDLSTDLNENSRLIQKWLVANS